MTEAVAELAPGDQLVEECLGGRRQPPPSLATSRDLRTGEATRVPARGGPDTRRDLVRRDVAEVQVRGESGRDIGIGMIALAVARELVVDEVAEDARRGGAATSVRDRSDGVI